MPGPAGGLATIKARAETTEGRFGALENIIAPGQGPVLHRHVREHESFYVLDGAVRDVLGDETADAGTGSFVVIPRGTPHCFISPGPEPARPHLFTPVPRAGHAVGRVVAVWRYPVKSMGAEALDEVEVSWNGVAGDRRWAFIRDRQVRSGFPWLTMRQRPDLGHHRPWFLEPDRPDASRTVVATPAGEELEVVDPALAAQLGEGVRVIKQDRGVFDTMPLSLITTRTVDGLGALVGGELDVLRFRPNLLIEATDTDAFPEDAWVGCTLRIGGLRMRVDQRDQRCVIVNIDPGSARRDPAILRAIVRERQACLGVYGSTVQPGRVAVGDPVVIDA